MRRRNEALLPNGLRRSAVLGGLRSEVAKYSVLSITPLHHIPPCDYTHAPGKSGFHVRAQH